MNKLLVVAVIFLFIGMSISSSTGFNLEKQFIVKPLNGKTLYVGGSGPGNYTKIKDAIDDAVDGDTVFVYDDSSPYYECAIIIEKSINLIGENRETTIIDSEKIAWGIDIQAGGVTISGFTLRNCRNYAAIMIFESSNNIISGNIISESTYGIIIVDNSNYNTVSDNIIVDSNKGGMYIDNSRYNVVSMNAFSDNHVGLTVDESRLNNVSDNVFLNDGIWVHSSYDNTISNNLVNDKPLVYLEGESNIVVEEAGQVVLVKCDNVTVQNQDLSNTCIGVSLDDTDNCLISGNNIFNSSSDFSGILLRRSRNNNISMNSISNVYGGIFFDASHDNTLFSNTIILNEYLGIYIFGSNSNNILMNSFSDNRIGLALENSRYNDVSDNVFLNDGVWSYGSYQNTFSNNLVNDKPLVYLDGESDMVIDEDAGQVILVSCDSITVQNNDLSNICVGVLLDDTDDCLISGNTISSNDLYGIFFTRSNGNNISMNTISNNNYGITFDTCDDNIILWNTVTLTKIHGIWLSSSNDNIISSNNIKKNSLGWQYRYTCITLDDSSNNEVSYNNFLLNGMGPDFYNSSSTKWHKNYWNRPRLLPKPILGTMPKKTFPFFRLWVNFDWRPALTPYEILGSNTGAPTSQSSIPQQNVTTGSSCKNVPQTTTHSGGSMVCWTSFNCYGGYWRS